MGAFTGASLLLAIYCGSLPQQLVFAQSSSPAEGLIGNLQNLKSQLQPVSDISVLSGRPMLLSMPHACVWPFRPSVHERESHSGSYAHVMITQ